MISCMSTDISALVFIRYLIDIRSGLINNESFVIQNTLECISVQERILYTVPEAPVSGRPIAM